MSQAFPRHETDTKVLVAAGSNVTSPLGPPEKTVVAAFAALNGESLRLVAASSLFSTPCFPAGAGPDFVNAAAVFETDLSPQAVLARLHAVEADFARTRDARWSARTLDLDLLAHDDAVLPDAATLHHWVELPLEQQKIEAPAELILPHPRMQDRGFVLVPLAEIAPDWRHPVLEKTVAQMLSDLPEAEKADIRAL